MSGQMYKVEIITRPNNVVKLKAELAQIGVSGITFTHSQGSGLQKPYTELYRGVKKEQNVYDRLKIEIVVSSVPVDDVIAAACKALSTGEPGDGKIFVYEIGRVIDIRTGNEGPSAL
ncbi:P-II family nitrogen regulator [Bacillus gobiensis]|uniref:P-II family nitrogen regulator n=1 Tax=Bacillus gobiensis TaxID=1441095 RepID=UPI003D2220B2